jgi:hypothetical protein
VRRALFAWGASNRYLDEQVRMTFGYWMKRLDWTAA